MSLLTQNEAHEGVVAKQQHVTQERPKGVLRGALLELLKTKLLQHTQM